MPSVHCLTSKVWLWHSLFKVPNLRYQIHGQAWKCFCSLITKNINVIVVKHANIQVNFDMMPGYGNLHRMPGHIQDFCRLEPHLSHVVVLNLQNKMKWKSVIYEMNSKCISLFCEMKILTSRKSTLAGGWISFMTKKTKLQCAWRFGNIQHSKLKHNFITVSSYQRHFPLLFQIVQNGNGMKPWTSLQMRKQPKTWQLERHAALCCEVFNSCLLMFLPSV